MTLAESLQWVEKNCYGEAVQRLRSRKVAKRLADEVVALQKCIEDIREIPTNKFIWKTSGGSHDGIRAYAEEVASIIEHHNKFEEEMK